MAERVVFDVRMERHGGATVVHVNGELDLATTPQLEETLEPVDRSAPLVVDLGECTFLDSTCVRFLISLVRETEAAGGRTALVATDPGILRVLEITALDTMVPVHPTVETALTGAP